MSKLSAPTKMTREINTEIMTKLYEEYITDKVEKTNNLFYAFITDNVKEIHEYLSQVSCKELLINEKGLYTKKTDIFRTVCVDKINQLLSKEDDVYCLVEQNIYIDDFCFHKPDVAVFCDFNEDKYDNYLDLNLENPIPSFIIEVIDFDNREYLYNLVVVYRRMIYLNNDSIILFVDPIKKELYLLRNDLRINLTEHEMELYLLKIDYYKNINFKHLMVNFEKILSRQ